MTLTFKEHNNKAYGEYFHMLSDLTEVIFARALVKYLQLELPAKEQES